MPTASTISKVDTKEREELFDILNQLVGKSTTVRLRFLTRSGVVQKLDHFVDFKVGSDDYLTVTWMESLVVCEYTGLDALKKTKSANVNGYYYVSESPSVVMDVQLTRTTLTLVFNDGHRLILHFADTSKPRENWEPVLLKFAMGEITYVYDSDGWVTKLTYATNSRR